MPHRIGRTADNQTQIRHQIRVQENQLMGQLVSEIPRPSPSTSLLSTPCHGTATFCLWLELQVTTDIPDLRALGTN